MRVIDQQTLDEYFADLDNEGKRMLQTAFDDNDWQRATTIRALQREYTYIHTELSRQLHEVTTCE